jgi:hypothetical protein
MENMHLLMQWVKVDRRATTIRTVALVFSVVSVVQLMAHTGQWNAVQNFVQGSAPDASRITAADEFVGTANLLRIVFGILYVVTYSMWLHASFKIIASVTMPMRKFSPYEAVISLFIPFLNFYQPYQALRELWQSSHAIERMRDTSPTSVYWWTVRPPLILLIWWLTYLGHMAILTVAGRLEGYVSNVATFNNYISFALTADVLGVLSGILLFKVVKVVRVIQTGAVQNVNMIHIS